MTITVLPGALIVGHENRSISRIIVRNGMKPKYAMCDLSVRCSPFLQMKGIPLLACFPFQQLTRDKHLVPSISAANVGGRPMEPAVLLVSPGHFASCHPSDHQSDAFSLAQYLPSTSEGREGSFGTDQRLSEWFLGCTV